MLNSPFDNTYSLNIKGKLYLLDTPKIMGIINITGDSFYAKSRVSGVTEAVKVAGKMLKNGADMIDIGGMSSRPGATISEPTAEINSVLPIVKALVEKFPKIIISVDTIHSLVADECLKAGASIINDISAGSYDVNMLPVVASHRAPFIAMHMPGKPANMQKNAHYADVTKDLLEYFSKKCDQLFQAGIRDVIVDPGFGFGKTVQHNYTLLKELRYFQVLRCPILVGISRKSMIYKVLESTPEKAVNGTSVLNTLAILNGAHILRVHDVQEALEVKMLMQTLT